MNNFRQPKGLAELAAGWPNRITLIRAILVALLAAALVQPTIYRESAWLVAAIALVVLFLDGLDGWLARRLDQCTAFGARFDMEVDAALIMVLCLGLAVIGKVGLWVLAIGLMRYAFVAAMNIWPWLRQPLSPSFRRKLVCVWQVASLLLALLPVVPSGLAALLAFSALALLAFSFAIDIAWLWRQRATFPVHCPSGERHEKTDPVCHYDSAVQRTGPGRTARLHD